MKGYMVAIHGMSVVLVDTLVDGEGLTKNELLEIRHMSQIPF